MRVLHVIPGLAPRYGGPSTAIGPMVAALNCQPGVIAEVAATDADGPGGRLDLRALPQGFVAHLFRRDFSERWKVSLGLRRWLRRHVREYDLVHIHAAWSFASAAAAGAARRASVPYVIRPAGMLSEYTWGRRALVKRLYWRFIERRNVYEAAAFHATSEDETKEIAAVRPGARTFVIPNGVEETARTEPIDRGALRRRCGPAAGHQPILLFLSRLHPKKGLTDLLLPAIARLKADMFLAIAGGADDHAVGYEREVWETIQRLGLGDRVALLGPVNARERWAMFDGAAAFVLPSHSENFGIVVAEAMARGCPVVVTDAVQASSHVKAAGAGWVVPLVVDRLVDALETALSSADTRRTLGAAGRQYVVDHLTWDRVAAGILEMYHACLPASRSTAKKGLTVA